jgi:hypothetical protein
MSVSTNRINEIVAGKRGVTDSTDRGPRLL